MHPLKGSLQVYTITLFFTHPELNQRQFINEMCQVHVSNQNQFCFIIFPTHKNMLWMK